MSRALILTMVRLLIVSLFTLNMAWAVDSCAISGCADKVSQLSISQDDSVPADQPTPGLDCDDWCNACVSHIALPNIFSLSKYVPAVVDGNSISNSYSSLVASPPTHPPIA